MTVWKGTKISSGIVIGDDTQTWPSHYSVLGAGGAMEVANIAGRNAIPAGTFLHPDGMGCGRRRNLMWVSVTDKGDGSSTVYQLTITGFNGLSDPAKITALANNANWTEINFAPLDDFVTLNGTQTLTNKTLVGAIIINPIINAAVGSAVSDQIGDMYYRDSAGEFTRLGIGTVGQGIFSTGTLPSWSYTLKNSSGVTTVNWDDFDQFDSSQHLSHDWSGRVLWSYESSSHRSIDYQNRLQYDNTGITSIDYQNRYLYASNGTTVTIDYNTGKYYNPNTGEIVIDFGNLIFKAPGGSNSWDIAARIQYDSSNMVSYNYNLRDFYSSTQTININYTTPGTIKFYNSTETFYNSLVSSPTANRTINIQDASGTLAFISDILGNYVAKTTTYTALVTDDVIECTSGTFTVTLFTASGNTGKKLYIKNSGVGTITVAANGGQTIDGSTTLTLVSGDGRVLISNGSNWIKF